MFVPRAYLYVALALLAVPGIGQAAKSASDSDTEGDTPDPNTPINFLNDGVLIVSGEQTSCEIALISKQHGLVAANCLLTDDSQPIPTSKLEIATHGSGDFEVIPVDGLTIHPDYDSQTLANNIAVVVFSTDKDDIEPAEAPLNSTKWDDRALFRRALKNVSKPKWNDPILGRVTDESQDLCKVASPIYAANKNDFICDKGSVSPGNSITSCKLPFGMGYGAVINYGTAPMAIYSHTVVFGDGLCTNAEKVHYYTMLRNYLAWAANAATQQGKSLSSNELAKANKFGSKDYKMKQPDNTVPVVKVYGGNLYADLPESLMMSSSMASESDDASTADNGEGDGESGLDTSTEPPMASVSVHSETDAQGDVSPDIPDYSTTTVEYTSFLTITTYSNSPFSSAPAGSVDGEGNGESGLDSSTSCTDDLTVDSDSYDCTETVYVDDCSDSNVTDNGSAGDIGTLVPFDPSSDNNTDSNESNAAGSTTDGSNSGESTADNSNASGSTVDDSNTSESAADGSNDEFSNAGTLSPVDPSDTADSDGSSDTDGSDSNVSELDTAGTDSDASGSDTDGADSDASGSDSAGSGSDALNTDDSELDSLTDDSNVDESQTDDESSVSDPDSSPNNTNESSGGISRTTAILVGILVPLAIIIIIVCLYFYFKKK
ncbi:hypothetical protein IWW50_000261 [Coemansia erecta]|nr:hypothetical protein IWW50_000261 [Coemansia erecta]